MIASAFLRQLRPLNSVCSLLGLAAALAFAGCVSHPDPAMYPVATALPSRPELPDPLAMLDGRKVTTPEQWYKERRPELKRLFQHYEYGAIPPAPAHVKTVVLGEYADFLDDKATLKLVRLETGPAPAPQIDLLVVLPNGRTAPAPVFLAMNFCGNHALTSDTRVPLSQSWMGRCAGCTNSTATEAARGFQTADWPLAEMVRRGYALAAFYSGDVDPDRAEASTGLYAWLANGDPAKNNPANRGTIAAWAWGFQRCVDYLVADRNIDPKRIAAVGHSRNGKTALLAAAMDERISIAYPHQAGCGGTSPARGKVGESVKAINDRFPHWFNANYKQFNDCPDRLPMDQNCLIALCAPRAVLISAAEDDQWSNPSGQLDDARSADAVYRFLAVPGLTPAPETNPAPLGRLFGGRLGYYYRAGKHSMTADDWRVFMDFADKQWR